VELTMLTDYEDVRELQGLISTHWIHTKSTKAEKVLVDWEKNLPKFVKVLPLEYKKVLNEMKLREVNLKLRRAHYDPNYAE
jgi:glutamate synthase (NADPH/NADH) large chain